MRCRYSSGEVLLMMMSTMLSFQVRQLRFKRKDLITSKLQQKLYTNHSRQFGCSTRRQPAELEQLDCREHAQFAAGRTATRRVASCRPGGEYRPLAATTQGMLESRVFPACA